MMAAVQKIRDEHERYQTKAVSFFPSGCDPHVPIDDAKTYPIYATCVELNLPVSLMLVFLDRGSQATPSM